MLIIHTQFTVEQEEEVDAYGTMIVHDAKEEKESNRKSQTIESVRFVVVTYMHIH